MLSESKIRSSEFCVCHLELNCLTLWLREAVIFSILYMLYVISIQSFRVGLSCDKHFVVMLLLLAADKMVVKY